MIFERINMFTGKCTQTVGVLVAIPLNDITFSIGMAKCNTKHDKFNLEEGIQLAIERAMAYDVPVRFPANEELEDKYFKFVERAMTYYKNKCLIVPKIYFEDLHKKYNKNEEFNSFLSNLGLKIKHI